MDIDIDTDEGMEDAGKWLENFVSGMPDGIQWGIPRSESIYRLFPSRKQAFHETKAVDVSTDRVFEHCEMEEANQ